MIPHRSTNMGASWLKDGSTQSDVRGREGISLRFPFHCCSGDGKRQIPLGMLLGVFNVSLRTLAFGKGKDRFKERKTGRDANADGGEQGPKSLRKPIKFRFETLSLFKGLPRPLWNRF